MTDHSEDTKYPAFPEVVPLTFSSVQEALPQPVEHFSNVEFLERLRDKYSIESLAGAAESDLERVRDLSHWVHSQWEHDGMNDPGQIDVITLLDRVSEGEHFRCVEYSLVLTALLEAVNIPGKMLILRTMDVETRPSGAGHLLVETYLRDLQKWIMVDPQWDVIMLLEGIPLNAVELQQAIVDRRDEIEVMSASQGYASRKMIDEYLDWIGPYLYYFGIPFQQSYDGSLSDHQLDVLFLKPVGARSPSVFQARFPWSPGVFTESVVTFYDQRLIE